MPGPHSEDLCSAPTERTTSRGVLSEVGLDGQVKPGRTHGAGWTHCRRSNVPLELAGALLPSVSGSARENDPLDAREIDDGIQVSFTTGEVERPTAQLI